MTPCTQCGTCCLENPCYEAVMTYGAKVWTADGFLNGQTSPGCPDLVYNPDLQRYYCFPMLLPTKRATKLKRDLAVGHGCQYPKRII